MKNVFTINRGNQSVPLWLIQLQCICFILLYAIWALPETIALRHISLIAGALIGCYEIFIFRKLIIRQALYPMSLIALIFIWLTFHLFFIGNDFTAQLNEYLTIWKRILLGTFFACGLGVTLGNKKFTPTQYRLLWILIYLGLIAPSLIYIVKFICTYFGINYGYLVPLYLNLHTNQSPHYLQKINYLCFCLPALAVSLGAIHKNIFNFKYINCANFIYFLIILIIFFIFLNEKIKNGIMLGSILISIFILLIFKSEFRGGFFTKLIFILLSTFIAFYFIGKSIHQNQSWHTFIVDAKVALSTEQYEGWKLGKNHQYPINELGLQVSPTNYERIAWFKKGLEVLLMSPFGYGLVESSFGHLAKEIWPDSNLTQTHSGWLDLSLGIGLPGVLMLFLALFLVIAKLKIQASTISSDDSIFFIAGYWILIGTVLMWLTAEASQKVIVDNLFFWLVFGTGLSSTNNNK